jgi:Ca-activated chloride channel family protein
MSHRRLPVAVSAATALLAFATALHAFARVRDDDERRREPAAKSFEFSESLLDASMGATPGGAQDVRYFRDRVAAGEIPHPNVFTPEGLFSEHDLPLTQTQGACQDLLCVAGAATDARLPAQPEVRYLAQLGFSSGLDPATYKRAPLHLVAVVDKSGSMSGHPLDLVRKSLHQIAGQLRPDDAISIVLYGDRAHVHLSPTPAARLGAIQASIDAIASQGSTAMEDGLRVGFDLARAHAGTFNGQTRVMLFTDERPNVGRTDAQSFMGMAEAASQGGVGMTTIGVGVQFGAELATRISSVRGGNLFFFADDTTMERVFAEEFDTMVTELAHGLVLEVHATAGYRIVGLYGIPGDKVAWTKGGGLRVEVATIFLSRRKGAIYVALAPEAPTGLPERHPAAPGAPLALTAVTYTELDGAARRAIAPLAYTAPARAPLGLTRGLALVDEATTLREATRLHHEQNDQDAAWQLVSALTARLDALTDPALAAEVALASQLTATLARLSGRAGEPVSVAPGRRDPVTGLPTR